MKYFAKLVFGNVYSAGKYTFERGVEQPVDEKLYNYLKGLGEPTLVAEGNGFVIKNINRFECRAEELTVAEKAKEAVESAPDKLKPQKPAR